MKKLLLVVLLLAVPSVAHAKKEKNPRHKQGQDPCVMQGSCGNGDHGKGNPVNGSLHANPNAWQGEVDPVAPVVTPSPTPTPTPTVPITHTPTCQVVITGTGAVEVALGVPFSEDNLVVEAPGQVIHHALPGTTYSVLEWTPYYGHRGRVRTLVVDALCVQSWAIEQDWPTITTPGGDNHVR